MAVIAGEVRVAQGEGGEVVAIQDELVVKEGETAGQARLERRERVLVAVPDEDGNVAVAEQVRVRAVEVGEVRMKYATVRAAHADVSNTFTDASSYARPAACYVADTTADTPGSSVTCSSTKYASKNHRPHAALAAKPTSAKSEEKIPHSPIRML